MKTFYFLLACILLIGCGSGEENTFVPCSDDFDCLNGEACIEGICVPMECKADSDCGDLEVCTENFKCASIWEIDQCSDKLCYGDCSECGPYTACYEGTCVNACDAFNMKLREYLIEICQDSMDCKWCECAVQGLEVLGESCGESFERSCTKASTSELSKESLEPENFQKVMDDYNELTRNMCKT